MYLHPFRLCIIFALLAPSLLHAAALGIPGPGTTLSGVGVISGWKCQAEGNLTVVFNNDGKHIPLLYGSERTDVRANGQCLENDHDNVGFVAIWNWGNLDDGEHTAVAYDNGVEFARNTFTVVRASEDKDFLPDVTAECSVFDFPYAGTNARFEWNTGTQHLELAEVGEDVEVPVSTQFDGVWSLSVSQDLGHTCDDISQIPGISFISSEDYFIKDGNVISSNFLENSDGDLFLLEFLGIIEHNGFLEGAYSFGPSDDDGYFDYDADEAVLIVGTLSGSFIEQEGVIIGEWMYAQYGCRGLFSFTKKQ